MREVEINSTAFPNCLEELSPRIGRYGWMWSILRACTGRLGRFPPKVYAALQRFGNPKKPYFIGRSPRNVAFLGDYRDRYAVLCMVYPEWDEPLLRFLEGRIPHSDSAYLDIGTNVGLVAATMARTLKARGQEVVAFEPIPATAKRAAATFALNGLTNLKLFRCAVGDEEGEITFFDAPGASESASANRTVQEGVNWQEIKVPCRTLDSLAGQGTFSRVGLMKIDVEGHEPNVIRGAQQLIRREKPDILFEYHRKIAPKLGWEAADVAHSIRASAASYRFHTLSPDGALLDFPPREGVGEAINIYCEHAR